MLAAAIEKTESQHLSKEKFELIREVTPDVTSQNLGFSISIIVPAHNEEKRLLKSMEEIIEYCNSQSWDYEVIVVEDGSTDKTVEMMQDIVSKNPRIKLISNKERLGKGLAIRHGVLSAEKEHVAYIDADLSSGPSELSRLSAFIDEFDIVIGSRILRGELPPIKRPFIRSFLSHCYSKLFRVMFRKVTVHDTQCGIKMFKSNIAQTLLTQIYTNGFAFDCEVLVKASQLGFTVKEVPVIWEHKYGSKVSMLHEIGVMSKDLLSVWYRTQISKK